MNQNIGPSPVPILGITMGDPAGIGPEVIVKALAEPIIYEWCRPVVLGDLGVLQQTIQTLQLDMPIQPLSPGSDPSGQANCLEVIPLSELAPDAQTPGRPTIAGGGAAGRYIEVAANMAMAGRIKGIVTAPISKDNLNKAGYKFQGHTQMLAKLAQGAEVVMMLAGPKLRIVLVTIHEALKDVPTLLTTDQIVDTARITRDALRRYFGLAEPRLAAAALNPHAGEGGMFGAEEQDIIMPAVAEAREEGIDLRGPYPADTLFHRAVQGEFDAVVCMYHDQGLIPLKLLHFHDGVNVTLGLPFIRTSVDHGTAFDIAGKGLADHTSMRCAIQMASEMARLEAANRAPDRPRDPTETHEAP